ncbi:MAG: FHA domain-containing protein [Saccharofermentanales bacterium]
MHTGELAGVYRLPDLKQAAETSDWNLDTALLRHRPDSVLPVSWFPGPDGCILVHLDTDGLTSLEEGLASWEKSPPSGFQLLLHILESLDQARDHLFYVWPDQLECRRIFSESWSPKAKSPAKLACLPFPPPDCGPPVTRPSLIRELAPVFFWEPSISDQLDSLLEEGAYDDLLAQVRLLAGSGQADKDDTIAIPHEKGPAPFFSSLIHSLKRCLSWPREDSIHESTQEVDLLGKGHPMAQLSEGLPGTPDEEYGRHAYILTPEFFIGRDMREADLCIDSPSISRLHARIFIKDGSFFLEDLGSSNGTAVDGVRLSRHRPCLLPAKCRIAFADIRYYFRTN